VFAHVPQKAHGLLLHLDHAQGGRLTLKPYVEEKKKKKKKKGSLREIDRYGELRGDDETIVDLFFMVCWCLSTNTSKQPQPHQRQQQPTSR
jgi:hypothetical protein